MGIEPTSQAWEAGILPMNYTRIGKGIIAEGMGNFNLFLSKRVFSFLSNAFLCAILSQGVIKMKEYELVREIQNLCRNYQMRDIFFEEVETDDPVAYVRQLLKGKAVELSVDPKENGAVTVYASVDGLNQKFIFTPI